MSIKKIDLAICMMEETKEEILSIGSASDSLITQAEQRLGVTFPDDYTYFLKKYGSLSFEAEEFYGLTKKGLQAVSIPCVIFSTEAARARGDIAKKMIKIKSSGYGPSFSLDLENIEGYSPIVETSLSYKRDMEKTIIADSFGDFFYNEIKAAIDDL